MTTGAPVALLRDHDRRVRGAARVRRFAGDGQRAHVDKGGVHHVVPLPGDGRFPGRSVDVSASTASWRSTWRARRCVAEPGVTFAASSGHPPPRAGPGGCPRLEGITVGGAVAAARWSPPRSGRAASTTRAWSTRPSPVPEILTCSARSRPFVFEMLHGSYGTLGILSRLSFRLVPRSRTSRAVRDHRSPEDFHRAAMEHCRTGHVGFVDGDCPRSGPLRPMRGRFVAPVPIHHELPVAQRHRGARGSAPRTT